MTIRTCLLLGFTLGFVHVSFGDQIQMQNGDRYTGQIVSMTADTVTLQNDTLGRISVPRAKVASLTMGTPSATPVTPSTNPSPSISPSTPIPNSELNAALYRMGSNTNFIESIRKQFLTGAGPEANAKFDDLVGNMVGGKFDMNHLREEAKAAAEQIRTLKQSGLDVGDTMNTYLAILDKFLKESAPTNAPSTHMPLSTNTGGTITIVK